MKCQAGWITSWNQVCQEKYQQPQTCRWYHSNGRKWRGTKEHLDEGERRERKSWLETQHSKNEDHGIWFHHFIANSWRKSRNSDRLYFLGLQRNPKKMKSVTISNVPSSICHEVIGPDAMILVFWMLSFKPAFSVSLSLSSRGSFAFCH